MYQFVRTTQYLCLIFGVMCTQQDKDESHSANILGRSSKGAILWRAGCFKEMRSLTLERNVLLLWLYCGILCCVAIIALVVYEYKLVLDQKSCALLSDVILDHFLYRPMKWGPLAFGLSNVQSSHTKVTFIHIDFHKTLCPLSEGAQHPNAEVCAPLRWPVRDGAVLEPFGHQAWNVGQPPTSFKK